MTQKLLWKHQPVSEDRVENVYACILGPYGEGNYPLRVPDWVDMGHCHEGYWCADRFADRAGQ